MWQDINKKLVGGHHPCHCHHNNYNISQRSKLLRISILKAIGLLKSNPHLSIVTLLFRSKIPKLLAFTLLCRDAVLL